jgi:hypothetical protein
MTSPIWNSWPDIYYSSTVTVFFLWGALSDERTCLSFVYAAGSCQRSVSRFPVPWDSRPYFTASDLRLHFSSPPRTRSVTDHIENTYCCGDVLSRISLTTSLAAYCCSSPFSVPLPNTGCLLLLPRS